MPQLIKTERNAAIVAAYANHSTRELAAIYGLTPQRISQLILKAEADGAPRAPRHKTPRGPRADRVAWRCPSCGVERKITKLTAPPRHSCGKCHSGRFDSRIKEWIVARLCGDTWTRIARDAGFVGVAHVHRVPLGIFLYLRRTNRLDEIPQIWRGSSTRWLFKRFPNALIRGGAYEAGISSERRRQAPMENRPQG